jgi:hypothetical protein
MDMNLFDPTAPPAPQTVTLAPRPAELSRLRIGLVDNHKFNADRLLLKLADRLAREHGMTMVHMTRKRSASHEVDEAAIAALKRQADFVVSGIGD